jgi:hypothetical protein
MTQAELAEQCMAVRQPLPARGGARQPTSEHGMRAVDAMRLIGEELVLDGIPMRNLAMFVTTWMEPEAQRVIAENLDRNFIDHAEYPHTAEIEQRCAQLRRVRRRVPAGSRAGLDGARVHAPPNADHVKVMRALVKLTLGHSLVWTLADDIAEACETLRRKGGLHELDRKRVKTGTGY